MPAARRLLAALVGAAVATGLFLVAGPAPVASATQRVTAAGATSHGASHGAVAAAHVKVAGVPHDHAHLDLPGLVPAAVAALSLVLLAVVTVGTTHSAGVRSPRPVGRAPPRR